MQPSHTAASPQSPADCLPLGQKPLSVDRMVVPALFFFHVPSRLLVEVCLSLMHQCEAYARHRGEMTVTVDIFLVCMLERDHKKSSSKETVAVRSAQKLGNKHGDFVRLE